MITPSDLKKIENFYELNSNHKRVFRHRLVRKCLQFQRDLEIVMLNSKTLKIDIDKIINLNQLINLVELYQNKEALQNE